GLPHEEVAVAVQEPEKPEDALFAADPEFRFAVHPRTTDYVTVGEAAGSEEVVRALGRRPVVAHDAKSLGEVPDVLAHDTEIGAYLLEPARRAYPFRELCEERGLAADMPEEAAADALLVLA